MLETAIRMEPEVAKQHYLDYRNLKEAQRTAEDEEIQKSYLELSRGRAIINAQQAVQLAGLGEDGRPRIAFCSASAAFCRVSIGRGEVTFKDAADGWRTVRSRTLELSLPSANYGLPSAKTAVPSIPPAHRPTGSLNRYWLMWEVGPGGWEDVPDDPALLRRLNPTTFAVLAVWDLTEVERMVLRGRSAE